MEVFPHFCTKSLFPGKTLISKEMAINESQRVKEKRLLALTKNNEVGSSGEYGETCTDPISINDSSPIVSSGPKPICTHEELLKRKQAISSSELRSNYVTRVTLIKDQETLNVEKEATEFHDGEYVNQ